MTWDLSRLYKGFDDRKFLSDLESAGPRLEKCLEMALALKSAGDLEKLIDELNETEKTTSALGLYIELTNSADAKNEDAIRYMDKVRALAIPRNKIRSAMSRFLSDKDIDAYAAASSTLKEHRYYLTRLKNDSFHTIAPELEETVLRLRMTGGDAFSFLRDQLDAGLMIEFGGKKLPLSAIRGMAYSNDPDVRRRAYEAELAAYPRIETPMAACLNSIKGEALTLTKLRNFDSVLDSSLYNSRMDRATLDALLGAMYESLPDFRRYFRAKAKKLGYEGGLKFYDIFAPVGKSVATYTLDEARKLLGDVFSRFSTKMSSFMNNAFEERWIDVYPREGKVGGAFCAGAHSIGKSYILANFDGSLASVGTFAHELGHAYHGYCLKDKSMLGASYPMPLAETASIFNETLLVNKLLETASADEKVTLLDQQIGDAAQVIVDILSRFIFESEVVERRKDHVLTSREMCDIMLDAQKKTYGMGLDEDCLHPYMWACKSHYYMTYTHFYNYPYAFGLLFGLGVYALYLEKGEAFLPLYDELLVKTSEGDIREVAASVGIDVADINFWRKSLSVIKHRIDEFEAV